ncbi:CsbD family protein [Micromonospora musae]|uniref:CsbD family protein n=1 Tax=Micromonospora musae TaxID=1894970 RepID=A0A3A9YMA5_9ACTN|nr:MULTISPECIES: CsbD family protein [Micromonospora]RKN16213.1 CsbD family protein [Micromonospora musae]RKN36194.1 CsbD family protein [Micromonospora musae]TYC02969.1 CsbD family protein [Micromonospora sp. WP24]
MSFTDKAKNKMEQMTGAAKERIGDMTDNESMRAEGATQQSEARVKQAGQGAKEAGKNARDAFR